MPARDRAVTPPGRVVRRVPLSVDVVLLTPRAGRLMMLLRRSAAGTRERWELPWDGVHEGEALESAAGRVARGALGAAPTLLEQLAAVGAARRHPGGAAVSVAFLGLLPEREVPAAAASSDWFPVDELPAVPPAQRAMVDLALTAVRARIDQSPIAFRLLPTAFTLSELQEIYELLLGRRLHKASFRRALHAAGLVEPTEEWRSEGRGRPAQLYRFAPRKRRARRRGVRFEGLSG